MTPAGEEAVREFLGTMHQLAYPQPIVAKAVDATLDDLNTWRKRNYLWVDGWESDGRVTYTGMGLLCAGLMNSLSWHFGPVAANEIVSNHINWLSDIERDTDLKFQDFAIKSSPGLKAALGEYKGGRERAAYSSDTLSNLAKRDMRQGPIVIFPVGALIAQWAIRARTALERA